MAPATMTSESRRSFATEVVARLRQAGFQALWAGGCVRDLILGLTPADYDVATDATPDRVMRLFRKTVPVGVSFGVVRVLGPPGAGEVEVATFRTDVNYVDGRRPEAVVFGSPREDASRRDFTINGMFLDPLSGQVIDYVGGQEDLKAGIIRAIGDPVLRFTEDKLRLLRAVRFAARFGFTIEPATRAALVAMAEQVHVVAAERIAQELRRMLVHEGRVRGMQLALDTGLVAAILPELANLKGHPSGGEGDDLWRQTLRVLEKLPPEPSFPLAMAALLHQTGRPVVESAGCEAETSHEPLSARIAEELARDLKLSNAERERIGWLVRHQQALVEPRTLPVARLKRTLASQGIDELLALHRAIALATSGDDANVAWCERYLREQPDGPIDPPPLVSGDDLVALGLRPGPEFKRLLETLRDAQLEGTIQTKEQALELVRRLSGNPGEA
jgi:poly(A) polymerase